MNPLFARELEIYRAKWAELSAHLGQFVVISGGEVLGIEKTRNAALELGYSKTGLLSFLVKEIQSEEPVECVPFPLTIHASHSPAAHS